MYDCDIALVHFANSAVVAEVSFMPGSASEFLRLAVGKPGDTEIHIAAGGDLAGFAC